MRVGIIGIAIYEVRNISKVNQIITENSCIVLGRMGMPLQKQSMRLISLIVEGDTDTIGRMAGQIGEIDGVEIKSMLMKEMKV